MKQSSPDRSARAVAAFRNTLARLRKKRQQTKNQDRNARRSLTKQQRRSVLAKTAGRCHVCGGEVGSEWQADHVRSHTLGGQHAEDNYLPAHPLCNNYRWHYLPEEFQYIMKIGVWARTQMEKETRLGIEMAERFVAYESRREGRRVTAR